ncbi:MAG: tetratricopeptide repeat protein [Panacagrimonas sp.]
MTLRLGALMMILAAMLAACASPSGKRESTWPNSIPPGDAGTAPAPGPTAPIPAEPPLPIEPVRPPAQDQPKTAETISGQAVVSLMRKASDARAQGQLELAASQLERAQRIEPRNYFVWSALAQVYLDQQQYDQAISVAGKSNSLARGNLYVEIENWKTIARAMQAKGDSIGALNAQGRVEEIERTLGGG